MSFPREDPVMIKDETNCIELNLFLPTLCYPEVNKIVCYLNAIYMRHETTYSKN